MYDGKMRFLYFPNTLKNIRKEYQKRMLPGGNILGCVFYCFLLKGGYLLQSQPHPTLLLTSCLKASNCGAN